MEAIIYKNVNGYVAKIDIGLSDTKIKKSEPPELFIIMDRSGSMGNYVSYIFNTILPDVLHKLSYANIKVHGVLFDSYTRDFSYIPSEMRKNIERSGGCTYMAPSITALSNFINTKLKKSNLRILTLTDGELHDQETTANLASELAKSIHGRYNINSQAIRFITSNAQPDTRGLACVLQLNTIPGKKIIDINPNIHKKYCITDIITELFKHDGLDATYNLQADESILKFDPWSESSKSLGLVQGSNLIWLTDIPKSLKINNCEVKIVMADNNTAAEIEKLIQPKLELFLNKIKVLKVINTADSNEQISKMSEYLHSLQLWLDSIDTQTLSLLTNQSLGSRIVYFKGLIEKRRKTLFQLINEVANDNKVAQLNSAQQAEYLRTVDSTKRTKSLSKRAITAGLDFTSIVHSEVLEMRKHLSELDNIDDSTHQVSFYCQDTTLGGIKAVCELVDQNVLEDLEATDILQMINIVGIAVNSQIGDYPDPMCWRVNEIYDSVYISVSDITMAYMQSGGQPLRPPTYPDGIITNVIPIFDDLRILRFLKKYAPSILEYTASIGMRRVIAGINMTFGYTLAGGIYKMIEKLNKSKTDYGINHLKSALETYEVGVGSYFDHIIKICENHVQTDKSFYIGNNGFTNMILPVYKMIKYNYNIDMKAIIRAIYTYEVYQIIKRLTKKEVAERRCDYLKELTIDLLGIDTQKYFTKPTDLFVPDHTNPVHCSTYYTNESLLEKLTKYFMDANMCVLMPLFFRAVLSSNPIEEMKKISQLDDNMICDELGLSYDINKLKLYAVYQALNYPDKHSRIDDTTKQMRMTDFVHQSLMETELTNYVSKKYFDNYVSRLTSKHKEEKSIVIGELINKLITTNDINEYCELLINGHKISTVSHSIVNNASMGFVDLKSKLLNEMIDVPLRLTKISILFTGKHNGQVIWNSGNLLRIKLSDYEMLFTRFDGIDLFKELREYYKLNPTHIYREKPNRQGHSNHKPSYWAYGYESLEEMADSIDLDSLIEYLKIHRDCCGVSIYLDAHPDLL